MRMSDDCSFKYNRVGRVQQLMRKRRKESLYKSETAYEVNRIDPLKDTCKCESYNG